MSAIDPSRHLDASAHAAPTDRLEMATGRSVRVVVGPDAAATVAGHHCAWMTINLLARITGVFDSLEVDAPPERLADHVNAHRNEPAPMQDVLVDLATSIAGASMDVFEARRDREVDVALVVGAGTPGDCKTAVYVSSDGWSGWTGRDPSPTPFVGQNPIGAYVAAALGVGEAYKLAAGLRPGRGVMFDGLALSPWSRTVGIGPIGVLGDTGPDLVRPDLGDIHLAGAGAVAHGFAALVRAIGASGRAVVVDGAEIDDSNINRYSLTRLVDIGADKADHLVAHLAAGGLEAWAVPHQWATYATGRAGLERIPQDLADGVRAGKIDTVLSFVDRNPARHTVQNSWPRRQLGASTLGLGIQVHTYDLGAASECLKCHNPLPRAATLEEIRDELLGLPRIERLRRGQEAGLTVEQIDALNKSDCGSLGAIDVQRFADARMDFAISFVSAMAGFLAAAALLRATVDTGGFKAPRSLYFNFLQPDLDLRDHPVNPDCTCHRGGRALWAELWGN